MRRYKEALEDANTALRIPPDSPEAHCNRGIALQLLGQYPAALEF